MSNTFDFVGKIFPCKETDNFKPYEKRTFDSGWTKTTLKFNAVCGTNRHMIESSVFTPKDLEDVNIYTIARFEGEEKAHKEIVNYADRLDPEIVAAVSGFKKFIVDTELPNRRRELREALAMFEDGTITDEIMTKLGVTNTDECKTAYDKSCKKRHEFIWEGDFVEYLHKFIANDKIKDMKWHITGEYALEYNQQNDQWYRKFKPQKVYRAEDDAPARSQGSFVVTFGRNAIDDNDYEDTKKLHISGYITQYLGKPFNKNCFAPMTFTVDANGGDVAQKRADYFRNAFTFPSECDGDYREYGVTCDIVDGAQVVEFTEDMLTDAERENIALGFDTFETIKHEHNKEIYGDKITDIVIVKPYGDYKKNGALDTVLSDGDVGKPKSDLDAPVEEEVEEKPKSQSVKVFDDVDDDDDEI